MWGKMSLNLQHRRRQQSQSHIQRHRPAYIAPSAGITAVQMEQGNGQHCDDKKSDNLYRRLHHNDQWHRFNQYEKIRCYDSEGDNSDDEHDTTLTKTATATTEDLQIPSFIEVPLGEKLRSLRVSPPSSEGSCSDATTGTGTELIRRGRTSFYLYSLIQQFFLSSMWQKNHCQRKQKQQQSFPSSETSFPQQPYQQNELSSTSQQPLKRKVFKLISCIYYVVSDILLLFFVCLMGLFFHVEVQVVKRSTNQGRSGNENGSRNVCDNSRGGGRIIIQTEHHKKEIENSNINGNFDNIIKVKAQNQSRQEYQYHKNIHNHYYESTNLLPVWTSSTQTLSIETVTDNNSFTSHPSGYLMSLTDDTV